MSTENNEVIKTVENVDELFETIVVNGETFTSSKYVAPKKTEKPTVNTTTTETSKEDDELLGRVTRAVQNVSAVELNDVNYPIKDENTYDKNTIDSKLEEAGKVKTVDYIAPDDNGNIALGVTSIKDLIPPQASESNQLADKNFVNSSVQTNTANFRGNWATWEAVPTEASEYPSDYAGNTTPTENDYMVVQDASSYGQAYEGTWRFKYSGNWAEVGKNGWYHEYQVNETPLTAEQLATLNSGLTATNVIKSDGANATSSGVSSMLNQLTEGTSDPQDNDYYISQYAGGGTTNITYHRRPVSALWNYIKGKISSILGLTATSYGGTSASTNTWSTLNTAFTGNCNDLAIGTRVSAQSNATNIPPDDGSGNRWYEIMTFASNNHPQYKKQIAIGMAGKLYTRAQKDNVWGSWVTIPSTELPNTVITIQTGTSKAQKISLSTLMSWLITTKKYIASNVACTKTIQASWVYADNDILQLNIAGTNYELQLAGVLIEFMGNASNYNTGVFRLRIHSSPTTYFTPTSGYTVFPVSHIAEYTCNGSGYTPTWRMISTITDIKMNGASKGTSGVVDLGTVLTSHQSLAGCATTTDSRNAYRATHIPTSKPDSNAGSIWIS